MDFEQISAEMQKTLTEFRTYVDRELKEIKATGVAAPETKDALDRLNKRIDELQAKMERPKQGAEDPTQSNPEYRKAFDKWARRGIESEVLKTATGLTMNADTNDADGGYAIPVELDRAILNLEMNLSPIRGICNVIQVGGADYKKLVNLHGTASGWVGESASRATTATPTLAQLTPYMGEIYAYPLVTQKLLDDAFFNVESWLANEIAQEFAQEEGAAFVSGNGSDKPKGFLDYTMASTADGTRDFGQIQYVASGASADFAASDPWEKVIDLIYTLKAAHRQNARFVTNKAVLAKVRKWKDGEGNPLWAPSLQAGQPSQLCGYPVTEAEDMPALGAGSYSVAFGDFRRAYTVVDRIGTRVLRDPFSNKPHVGFYTTKRVGGFLADSEAIKVMKFSA